MKNLSDDQLFTLCKNYGKNALLWKRKFIALLPEVYKRRLYRKKQFGSIFEFAAKLGGVSKNTVREVLRIDEKLKDMPILKEKIAEIGLNKIRIVANIVTKETEDQWAKKAITMTKSALETHVRDLQESHPGMSLPLIQQKTLFCNEAEEAGISEKASMANTETQNSFLCERAGGDEHAEGSETKSLKEFSETFETFSVKLSPRIIQKLKVLKANMKLGTCWNDVFENLISQTTFKKSRARNLKIKAKAICEVPACKNPATIIHHLDRYSITKNHNRLISVCKQHHELLHRGYIDEQNNFEVLVNPIINPEKRLVDKKMLEYLKC
jgi:hypothetical protein